MKQKKKLPKDFDPANLTNLFVDRFLTSDKFHRNFISGSNDGYVRIPEKNNIMKLPRDNNGKLDVSNWTYSR